jgi:hypothetical protein
MPFTLAHPAAALPLWCASRRRLRLAAGIQTLLPVVWRLPAPPVPRYALLPTSAALLLAAASHIVWDAFTHASGWGVGLLPGLARSVELGPALVPWFKVLQHGSSAVGLMVLASLAWRWMSRQPPVSRRELLWRVLVPGIALGLAGVLNGLRFLVDGIQQFVVAGGVAVTLALGLGLVVLGLLRTRRASASSGSL